MYFSNCVSYGMHWNIHIWGKHITLVHFWISLVCIWACVTQATQAKQHTFDSYDNIIVTPMCKKYVCKIVMCNITAKLQH